MISGFKMMFFFLPIIAAFSGVIASASDRLVTAACKNEVFIKVFWEAGSKDQTAFSSLLREVAYEYLDGIDREVSVLSLGCGTGSDLLACNDAFDKQCSITGYDVNKRCIEGGERIISNFPNITLACRDAASLNLESEREHDIVILRGAEPFSGEGSTIIWRRMFANAERLIRMGGLIIVTSYFADEARFFARQRHKTQPLHDGPNPFFVGEIHIDDYDQQYGRDMFWSVSKRTSS